MKLLHIKYPACWNKKLCFGSDRHLQLNFRATLKIVPQKMKKSNSSALADIYKLDIMVHFHRKDETNR